MISLAAQAQQGAEQPPANSTSEASVLIKKGQPERALALLRAQLTLHPEDATANLLAATAEIALYQPAQAVQFAERARALEPDNWKTHTTLVVAYAMAGKRSERDAERATLHKLHLAGKETDAAQASGFLVDTFKVTKYRIEAVEYFAPVGKFHIYFRFVIRNMQGQRVWQVYVESDDFNQASWAKAYPKQAAEGQRQFQIAGEGEGIRQEYRSFSGSPDYDWVRARIIDVITAKTTPFPGEAP